MAGYALDAAFGFGNALIGFAVATAVTFPLTLTAAFAIARKHIDIDLLTRGAGFGYLGSTLTSLVYATYTLIFLAYEGAIMGQALSVLTHLELHISYAVVALVMIPLTVYGMSFTARFQAWTWPLWVALIGVALWSAATAPHAAHTMVHPHIPATAATGVTVLAVFTIAAAQFGLRGLVRRRRHGHLPVPRRDDLLALLFHRGLVPGPVQAQRVAARRRTRTARHARDRAARRRRRGHRGGRLTHGHGTDGLAA
jgi:signal transduction histidine kinase